MMRYAIIEYRKYPDHNRDGSDEYTDNMVFHSNYKEDVLDENRLKHYIERSKEYGVWYEIIYYNSEWSYNSYGGNSKNIASIDKGILTIKGE